MTTAAVNHIINTSGIGTGDFLVYYDFNSYVDDKVISVSGANSLYTGEINGVLSTGSLGEAYFSGGYGGLYPYINVQNSDSVYGNKLFLSEDDFTILFKGSHLTQFDVGLNKQKPLNNKDVVFTNFIGKEAAVSGWEVGINGINKLYMKTYNGNQPFVMSYIKDAYGENIWAARYSNSKVLLSRFNPANDTIDTNSFQMPFALSNGGNWVLGSGKGISEIDSTVSNGVTSALHLTDFMYFSQYLSDEHLKGLSLAMLGDTGADITYSTVYTSGLSGVEYTTDIVSGLIWETGVLSGYKIESTGSVTINRAIERTGLVPTSGGYFSGVYQVSGDTTYYLNQPEWVYQVYMNTGAPFVSITGLDYSPQTIYLTGLTPVYYFSGISGIVESGLTLSTTISGKLNTVETTGYKLSNIDRSLVYPKTFSYLGLCWSGDHIEILSGARSYASGIKLVNNDMRKEASSVFLGDTLHINPNYLPDSSYVFMNGLNIRNGDISVRLTSDSTNVISSESGDYVTISSSGTKTISYLSSSSNVMIYDGQVVKQIILERDYALTGLSEIVTKYNFYISGESENLFGVADYGQISGIQELTITDTSQYLGAPFSEISPEGKWVFFNGQKIYPSIDYLGTSDFTPTGLLTGITGIYHAISGVQVSGSFTGQNENYQTGIYSVVGSVGFHPQSNIVFINGVRKSTLEFIEHDITKDLISGVTIDVTGDFSGYGIFFEA